MRDTYEMTDNDTPISPTSARFIKLGETGKWEQSSLQNDQVLRLDYISPMHAACMAGDWDAVTSYWLNFRKGKPAPATNDVRQIRDFYEMPPDTLWFTFYGRVLWWCFAKPEVIELRDKSRVREVNGTWRNTDLAGRVLSVQNLDGRLTKVVGYRGTICGLEPDVFAYLVRKINAQMPAEVAQAEAEVALLLQSIERLIKGLWWKDFELLADLIFAKSGWQRVSVLGQTEKAIDLDLEAPVTGKKAFVQVKSQATLQVLHESIAEFENMAQFDEFYFIFHTGAQLLAHVPSDPRVQLIGVSRLAQLVLNAGLTNWLINKRS